MNLHIYLLNVQGLTESKILEIQEFVKDDSLVCLTETQQKIDKYNIKNDIEKYVLMRKKESKKGGGLMILKNKKSQIQIEEIFTVHEDCMGIICGFHGFKFLLLNAYYKSNDSNVDINGKIDKFLQSYEDVATIVVGDFNAHTGQLGEPLNKNGKLLMELVEGNNLTILNGTMECEGKVTWEGRGHKSAIDYMLVNQKMLEKYKYMKIDEDRELTDLSDHCVLRVMLALKTEKVRQKQNNVEVNCLSEERLEKFVGTVEKELSKVEDSNINMGKIDAVMKEAAGTHIKKVNRKARHKPEKGRYETIWMTEKVRKEIKLRKRFNRLKRNNLNPDIEAKFTKRYQEQKQKVKEMVREEVHKHEQKVTEEIKKDKNGKLWENINYLRGKNKNKITGIGTFDENGAVIEEKNCKENLTSYWKGIYRKSENNIDEIWNSTKEQYILGLENNTMEINEYRFPSTLREQKMVTAINNTITKKEIPDEWSSSTTKLIPKTKKPTAKDFRPIALTECSYKICMGIIKDKIEDHLRRNDLSNEMQFGFTKKEDN